MSEYYIRGRIGIQFVASKGVLIPWLNNIFEYIETDSNAASIKCVEDWANEWYELVECSLIYFNPKNRSILPEYNWHDLYKEFKRLWLKDITLPYSS